MAGIKNIWHRPRNFGEWKFNDQGGGWIRLRPGPRVPTRLLAALLGLEWTTNEIRRACDVLDRWEGRKKGIGRPAEDDEVAIDYMASIRKATGITKLETLANMALKVGLGRLPNREPEANVKRLAGKLRAVDQHIAAKAKKIKD
jgi:hypothetical protein